MKSDMTCRFYLGVEVFTVKSQSNIDEHSVYQNQQTLYNIEEVVDTLMKKRSMSNISILERRLTLKTA